jgi:6-phosphofructokinase 1
MVASIEARKLAGSIFCMIIVAEGAIDVNGNPVTVQMVQDTLNQVPGTDSRVTILGHVQRGGIPSALDRTLVIFN